MQAFKIRMEIRIRKHPVKTAPLFHREILLPPTRKNILIRRRPHARMQFICFLQNLPAVAKTHDGGQQSADFYILLQRIAMGELHRVILNKIGTMIGRSPLL